MLSTESTPTSALATSLSTGEPNAEAHAILDRIEALGPDLPLCHSFDYIPPMKTSEILSSLRGHPDTTIRFQLPDHQLSAAHAHVTEVARIDKHFIDCGGTFRKESTCRLQTWVADDVEHRLSAKKLAGIIEKGAAVIGDDDLEMEVEHDVGFVTQFAVRDVRHIGNETIIALAGRHTACLAPEKCCPPPRPGIVSLGQRS